MIHRVLPVVFLFLSTVTIPAFSIGTVTGRVYDRLTGDPLPGATVTWGRGLGTATDRDGIFLISPGSGSWTLNFRYVGYRQSVVTVNVVPGDTVNLEVPLDPEASTIDQVVVSAGKTEQRLSELTVSLSIIDPQVASSSHVSDAADLLNRTPGIEIMDGQASVRGGSGYSYGAGSRVLALIDGLPVLSADAGNIKWHFLPLENISQVELIKGASSVLYGSSALNGVINFRTARAGNEPVTRFYAETGVFGRPDRREWVWWDTPRTFQSGSLSHLKRSGNTDLGASVHISNDNGYRRLNDEKTGRLSILARHDNTRVEGLSYGATVNAGFTRKRDFVLWENAWTGALRQDESTALLMTGNLITVDPFLTLERADGSEHDLRARFQTSDNSYPDASNNDSRARSILAEYRYMHSLSSQIDVSIGAVQNYSIIESPFYGDHRSFNLAGYMQADFIPAERLRVTAGLRSEVNSLNSSYDKPFVLFRAGINYRIAGYTFLRASFGQGYRYPSIAEKFAATTLGSVRIVPNPDIVAESGWSTEIGVKQGILSTGINGQVDIALFYSENRDMIEFLFGIYPVPGTDSYSFGFMATNVEQSRVYGVETGFGLSGSTGMFSHSLTGGYVYTYPVEFDGTTGKNTGIFLKYRRKHSAKLSLVSHYGKFEAGLLLQAASRILNIDDVFINELTRETILPGFYDYRNENDRGYILADPHIGYSMSDVLTLSLAVRNVLNTEYMGRPGDIMPHRNFSIRLSAEF